jgi:glycosyltransferase involved in cell wall biosynthesis
MMRVAFVSEYPRGDEIVGGVQAVVRSLATEMAGRSGVEVHAVSFHPGLGEPCEDVVHGVFVHRFPATSHLGNLTLGWAERATTTRALRAIAPDVAHAHVLGPAALGTAASGIPWTATAHGMQEAEGRTLRGWKNRIRVRTYRRMERMSLRHLRHLIVISPYVLEYFGPSLAGIRTHAIENPVAPRFFEIDAQPETGTILFVGRLIPRKNLEGLIAAAGRLKRAGVPFRLRIAGSTDDSAYEESLRTAARREDVSEDVRFLGAVRPEDVARELGRAAIFVLPSHQETASVAIMEAMAAGRAVVATTAGGTSHIVEEGRSGRVVPIGDADALASSLAGYLADPASARAHGDCGRRIAEQRFRLDRVVDRTLSVYEQVAADGRRN